MYPKGTIYEYSNHRKHGEVILHASLLIRTAYGFIRGVGAGLIGFAIIGFIFSFGPIIREEVIYRFHLKTTTVQNTDMLSKVEAERAVMVQAEAQNLGINSYFSVVIPKINATSNIIANVDASNEKEYDQALLEGVAHARGTYFPGQGKRVYLFAHSTDSPWNVRKYNAVFYLLRELEKGDRVVVFFADKKFEYEVDRKVLTNAKDVSWINDIGTEEELVLQTCDPPGTQFKRLLVIAKPVSN